MAQLAVAVAQTIIVFTTLILTGVSAIRKVVRWHMIMMPGATAPKQV
jgi:hypothetical protein